MSIWQDLLGTTKDTFGISLNGPKLKDNAGVLEVRNTADSAYAQVTSSQVNVTGDQIILNSDGAGGADSAYTIQRPAAGMAGAVTLTLPTTSGTVALVETSGTVTSVEVTSNSAALVVAGDNPITTDGTITLSLDADLTAVAGLSGTGIATRTAADTWATRSVAGTNNRVTITNGDGVAGNPTVDIAATYVGQSSIQTVGTITTGTWNGTAIGPTFGGTGLATYAAGSLIYASAADTLAELEVGTDDQLLTVVAGVPTWQDPPAGTTPGGAAGQVQFNDGTDFAGVSGFSFIDNVSPASKILTLGDDDSDGYIVGNWRGLKLYATDDGLFDNTNGSGINLYSRENLGSVDIFSASGQSGDAAGGNVNINAGQGYAPDDGVGGSIYLTAGSGDTDAGDVIISSGNTGSTQPAIITLSGATASAGTIGFSTNNLTRLVIGVGGDFLIGGSSAGTSGQVLTSGGAGAPPTWSNAAAGTVTSVAVSSDSAALVVGGSPITSNGTITLSLDSDLTALGALAGTGISVRTGTGTWDTRSISGASNRISITNANGVSGDPVIDISASYVGQASITTLGTIATGTWNGTAIGPTFGGTGQTTYTTGDLVYASATNTLSKRAIGTTNQVLTVIGGVPTWQTPTATSAAGSTNQIQYNSGGAFAAEADFTWDASTNTLGVGTSALSGIIQPITGGSPGTLTVRGGPSSAGGGDLILSGGLPSAGSGGGVQISGANAAGTAGSTRDGGSVSISAGGTGDRHGGNVTISTGISTGSGQSGALTLRTGRSAQVTRLIIHQDGGWQLGSTEGNAGQVLTSNGANTPPTWTNAATGTVTSVTVASGSAALTVTNPTVTTSGTINLNLDSDLTAVGALAGTGFAVRTGTGTWDTRSITGQTNRISVTNANGVSGDPVLDIAATYVGQTSITTLGTIATGTWNGTAIGPTFGGTGQTSYATGDILYANNTNTLAKLAAGTDGQVLVLDSGVPVWSDAAASVAGDDRELQFNDNGTLAGAPIRYVDLFGNASLQVGEVGNALAAIVGAPAVAATDSGVQLLLGGGNGGTTSGAGGAATLQGGTAQGAGNGGAVSISGGGATGAGNGGNIAITGGIPNSQGTGGNVTITSGPGAGTANSGNVSLVASVATGSGTNGSVGITTGGVERISVNPAGAILVNGTAGTSGQVLTSAGAGAEASWTNGTFVSLAGSALNSGADITFSGGGEVLGLPATPTTDGSAASKAYVDAVAAGITWKNSVEAATTANVTLSGEQTVDGVALVTGDRVLVKNQTTGAENGIYIVDSGAWTRSEDFDETSPIDEINGAAVFVQNGTTQANTGWVQTSEVADVGTDTVTFTQFSGVGSGVASLTSANAALTFNSPTGAITATVVADGVGISVGGSGLQLVNNGVTNAKFRQSAALSVVGNSTNATANVADIAGTANQVLRVASDGSTLAFGAINLASSAAVTGTLPIANGGTGQTTATAAFDGLAPTTTKGDVIVHNGTNNIRVAVGTNGQVLVANSGTGSGVEWQSPAAFSAACLTTDSTTVAFNSGSTISAFTLPANAVVDNVKVVIDTQFDGTPTLAVGISGTANKYMATTDNLLTDVAKTVFINHPGEAPVGGTEAIQIAYSAGSATTGSARVIVTYSVPN